MRLIDADNMDFTELADKLATIGMTGDLTDNGAEELLKEFIDAQPTAYDVEKADKQILDYFKGQIDKEVDGWKVVDFSCEVREIVRNGGKE